MLENSSYKRNTRKRTIQPVPSGRRKYALCGIKSYIFFITLTRPMQQCFFYMENRSNSPYLPDSVRNDFWMLREDLCVSQEEI